MELPDKSGMNPPALNAPKVQPEVEGAKLVKRPASKRFKDFLLAESPKDIAGRVARESLWPKSKQLFFDTFMQVLGQSIGVESSSVSPLLRGTTLRGGVQTYQGISPTMASPMTQAMMANQNRPVPPIGGYQDVAFESMQQAETLLAYLIDLLQQYHRVTVADLYEVARFPTMPSHENMGWTDLSTARITKSREGFLLELPRPTIL